MSKFMSLSPSGLPQEFDVEVYSEKHVISVDEGKDAIEISVILLLLYIVRSRACKRLRFAMDIRWPYSRYRVERSRNGGGADRCLRANATCRSGLLPAYDLCRFFSG